MNEIYDHRPPTLPGITVRKRTSCGSLYITCNFYKTESGLRRLVEVFFDLGKAGNCQGAFLDSLAITLSTSGKCGVDLLQIAHKLVGTSCPQSMPGDQRDPNRILSCSDAIGKAMIQAWESWNKGVLDGDQNSGG